MLETSAPPRPPGRSLSAPTAGRALGGALAKRSWRCAAGCQLVLMAALADLFLRRGLLLVALSHLVAHPPRAAARARAERALPAAAVAFGRVVAVAVGRVAVGCDARGTSSRRVVARGKE